MKHTARIISKNIFNGLLTVEVEYRSEDSKDIFNDKIVSSSSQDDDWLETSIIKRLLALESLEAFMDKIPINAEFTTVAEIVPNSIKETAKVISSNDPKEQYKQKLGQFNQWKQVYINGFIDENNKDFIALVKWLTNNFKPEYIDLF